MTSLAKFSKPSVTIGLCSMANFINSADKVIMPITIIQMSSKYGWDLHDQGWVLSSFSLGYFSTQVLGARAAKKFGSKIILLLAVLVWSLATLITPFVSHSFRFLILLRILLGMGEGIGLPTIFHMYAHILPLEHRSKGVGYLVALGSIGQTFATIICPHLPWETSFYLFGCLGFLWCIFWVFLYYESRGISYEDEFVQPPPVPHSSPHWIEFIKKPALLSIYISHFSMNWSSYIIMIWLPTYFSKYLGANPSVLMFTAMPYIFNSISAVVSGHVADNLIKRQWSLLSVRRLMTFVGLIFPAIFLLIFSNMKSLTYSLILITLSMGLSACNSAGHLSNHADVAPNHAGITFAISNMIATIPGVICGPLTAHLVTQSSHRWFPVFVLASFISFVAEIIYQSHSSASQII